MYTKEDRELVKQSVDMVKYLEEKGVSLTPSGVSLKGLCPIHGERSPSFHVKTREATGSFDSFHCFGCGASGDVIELAMQMETLSFPGAILFLAERADIKLSESEEDPEYQQKQRLYSLCKEASGWFHANLLDLADSHPARQNLLNRKLLYPNNLAGYGALTDPIVGWSDRGQLLPMLQGKGFSVQEIIDAGFATRNERGLRETFMNRLIWTVQDPAGRAIGFSGRKVMADDESNKAVPKYVNSPQTLLYNKSAALLGLAEAKREIAKKQEVVIVEGNADLLAFRSTGLMNVVSTCGTAFGDTHSQILSRLSAAGRSSERFQIVLCFDGDAAGIKAAKNVFEKQKSVQLNSYVVVLPDGQDPAEYRLSASDEELRAAVDKKIPLVEFILQEEMKTWDVKTPEGLVGFLHKAREILNLVANDTQRDSYFRLISFWTGASMDQIRSSVGKAQRTQESDPSRTSQTASLADRLLGAAVQYPAQFKEACLGRNINASMFPQNPLAERILAGNEDLTSKPEVVKLMHLDLGLTVKRTQESILGMISSYQRQLYIEEIKKINQEFAVSANDDDMAFFAMMERQQAAKELYQVS